MKTTGFKFQTKLQMPELGAIFRSTAEAMYSGSAKLAAGLRRLTGQLAGAQGLEFFTPRDESPFSTLDADQPNFSVGVSIPKASGTGGGTIVIQMLIWDRASHRDVTILSPVSMGNKSASSRALDLMRQSFVDADPQAQFQ